MYTTYEVKPRENEDNRGEKITVMQQCSTEQRSTVDSRRRLTNLKMLVSQSMSAVLRQSV